MATFPPSYQPSSPLFLESLPPTGLQQEVTTNWLFLLTPGLASTMHACALWAIEAVASLQICLFLSYLAFHFFLLSRLYKYS